MFVFRKHYIIPKRKLQPNYHENRKKNCFALAVCQKMEIMPVREYYLLCKKEPCLKKAGQYGVSRLHA